MGNLSVVARLRSVVRRYKLPSKAKRFTFSDALDWMRQVGPWREFLVAAVGIVTFAALTGVVAVALFFISSSLNAAFASFLVAVSTVGFIMAFLFSSITVVYVGVLGFGGLTIGSIAFFSVWAVVILSGWAAIAWVIWQGLRKRSSLEEISMSGWFVPLLFSSCTEAEYQVQRIHRSSSTIQRINRSALWSQVQGIHSPEV